jgi:starvation-inducible outer membrane lipoprotein
MKKLLFILFILSILLTGCLTPTPDINRHQEPLVSRE